MKHQRDNSKLVPQLQKFALQQIDVALDFATNPAHETDLAVHETRRCLKRLRALLQLVRYAVGDTIYDRDRRYLRNLGRSLATLRDATASQQTLDSLQQQAVNALPKKTWQAIRKGVQEQQPRAEKTLAAAAAKLKIARSRIANWPLTVADEKLLRKALCKSYRQGRRAMTAARAQPQAERLHEWRKRVNQLRHQLRILQALKLISGKARLAVSRDLAQALGTYNDLAMLATQLSHLQLPLRTGDSHRLAQLIETAQAEAETTAKRLGLELYRNTAKSFLNSLSL